MENPARYTHGHADSVLSSHRVRTAENSAGYLLPHLVPALRILDVGSGVGTITVDLAERVPTGSVSALETTTDTVNLARTEAERRGVTNLEYLVGDIHGLDIPDDSFDVVHAHQVLQHVADPVQALREMVRVCKPGGIVAVRDADYGGIVWYPALPELTQWRDVYCAVARANGGEPDAGRRLLAWAHEAGCTNIDVSASTWCYADPPSRQVWGYTSADRITTTTLAEQVITKGLATADVLEEIATAWRTWAEDPDGWILIPHGELIIHVS